MKITAIIPTRGRPHMLAGCIHTFVSLQSWKHEVVYAIACDQDDAATIAMAFELKSRHPQISITMYQRLPAIGQYFNETAARVPGEVYCAIGDDTICASPFWDSAVAEAMTENPKGLWWWSCIGDRQAIYPIMSDAWRVANDGRICTDLFPFWFDDVWLREVGVMVLGHEVPRIEKAALIDCPTPTTRMRDLIFWDDFYQAARPARVHQAEKIAKALGLEATPNAVQRMMTTFGPNLEFRAKAQEITDLQGDKNPPSREYLLAKARAERVLARIGMLQARAA